MSLRPRYAGTGRLRLPDDVTIIAADDGPGQVDGRFGPDERDPFERTDMEGLLISESFARAHLERPDQVRWWYLLHGALDIEGLFPRPSSRPAAIRALRFRDGLGDVLAEQALVRWHLGALVRLSESGELGEPERDLFPALRHPEGGVLWLGGRDDHERRITAEMAAYPRFEDQPGVGGREEAQRWNLGPIGVAEFLDVWWPRAHAAWERITSHDIEVVPVPRGAWGRAWAAYDQVWGAVPAGSSGLPMVGRPDWAARGRSTAPRAVCPKGDRHGPRARSHRGPRRSRGGPLRGHRGARLAISLLPIHLQLLEAYRRVTEGAPGAVRCRECGHPILALDPRRTAFCNDRDALPFLAARAPQAVGDAARQARHPTMTRRGPGEGSIYQRKDGRWAGSVHIGYEGGRRIRKHVLGTAAPRSKTSSPRLQQLQAEDRPIPDLRTKLGPYLRSWLDEVAKPTIRYSTYKSYDEIVRKHLIPDLGRIPLAKLSPADVQAFLNAKSASGLSPRRVQYCHAVLRRALGRAERWGIVTRNVAKLVDPPRVPRHEISPLTPEQAQRLIETSAKDDRLPGLYVTALGTGLRQGELLGLRWEDVDLEVRRLRVRHTLANVDGTLTLLEPKTDRSRRLVVLPTRSSSRRCGPTGPARRWTACVAGSRWVDSGHVFTTMLGKPLHAATITRAFQAALDRAGLPDIPLPRPPPCRRHLPVWPRASPSRTSSSSSGTRRSC